MLPSLDCQVGQKKDMLPVFLESMAMTRDSWVIADGMAAIWSMKSHKDQVFRKVSQAQEEMTCSMM